MLNTNDTQKSEILVTFVPSPAWGKPDTRPKLENQYPTSTQHLLAFPRPTKLPKPGIHFQVHRDTPLIEDLKFSRNCTQIPELQRGKYFVRFFRRKTILSQVFTNEITTWRELSIVCHL